MSSSIDARPLYRKPFLRFHEEAEQLLAGSNTANLFVDYKKVNKTFFAVTVEL